MDSSVLALETVDQVVRITLQNPPVNALDLRMLVEFEAALESISERGDARALVLRSGCPGFFSAGDDIDQLREMGFQG